MTLPILNIQSHLLYRDALMLVLNKPAGIAVHAGSKKNDSLERYFEDLKFGLPRLPALAHRLDRDTSGCLVLGRHPEALRRLGNLFQTNQIHKTYWAIVDGTLKEKKGTIDLPLAPQSEKKYHWWMKVDSQGKSAITEFKVLQEMESTTLLELRPKTGRTHQLRVHCAAIGHPIVGDKIYNMNASPSNDLHLHAYSIEIPLYYKKSAIKVIAPLPSYINAYATDLMKP